MTDTVAKHLLRLGWSLPSVRMLAPRETVTMLYHGVPSADASNLAAVRFEQHVLFLKRHFSFVAPHDREGRRKPQEQIRILLTFDDGFRNNAEVVAPILRRHNVPAVFFVSSRHAAPGKYLWFSYLDALERSFPGRGFSFRDTFFSMSPNERKRSVERLREALLRLTPHPAAMYKAIEEELPCLDDFVGERERADRYAGMTVEQVGEIAADPLFAVGVHTVDHPFLTRCEPAEALRQVQDNRTWLEAASGARCDAIAYPSGDYDAGILRLCERAGFTRGYAVSTRIDRTSPLEISRIGIYSQSTDVLGFKVQWGSLMRKLLIPIG